MGFSRLHSASWRFFFAILLSLASAATLALERPQARGVWHMSPLVLVALNAATGFVELGGIPAFNEGLWCVAATCAAAGVASAGLATFCAMHVAAILEMEVPKRAAHQIVSLALAAGIILLIIVARLGQPPLE